jgi:hypothetical protein
MSSLMALTQYAFAAHGLSTDKLAQDTGVTAKNLGAAAAMESRRVALKAGMLSLCRL